MDNKTTKYTLQQFIDSATPMSNDQFTKVSGSDQHCGEGVSMIVFAGDIGVSIQADGKYFAVVMHEQWTTENIEELYSKVYFAYHELTGFGYDKVSTKLCRQAYLWRSGMPAQLIERTNFKALFRYADDHNLTNAEAVEQIIAAYHATRYQ